MSHDISGLGQIISYEADSLRGLRTGEGGFNSRLPRFWHIYDSFVPHEAGNGQQLNSLHRSKRQTAVSWAMSRWEDGDRLSEKSMVRAPRMDRT